MEHQQKTDIHTTKINKFIIDRGKACSKSNPIVKNLDTCCKLIDIKQYMKFAANDLTNIQ